MSDATLSTISHSNNGNQAGTVQADELVLLLECDRPLAGSARHRLTDVTEVALRRGQRRTVERDGTRLTLAIQDQRVSTLHATIRREGLAWVIVDERSKNGLVVNGRRVDRQLLRDGDIIECGRTFFLFRVGVERADDALLDVGALQLAAQLPGLSTFHAPLEQAFDALCDVAVTSLPVLILGPSGTGKELVSRALHALSRRRGTLVSINCGALPESLVEAELFGARKGAFTGAVDDKPGLVRASDQGTLFLDEIGDLPLRAQPALLRVLQEREVLAVGATKPQPVDLRVVCATHRDLDELVRQERFRADLVARISGFVVKLPTLRERLEDFGLLVSSLLTRYGGADTTLSPEALRALLRHGWPLNIRELEQCLRAALALSPQRIDVAHLPASVRDPAPAGLPPSSSPSSSSSKVLTAEQRARREELVGLLTANGGNISAVARHLGKDRVQIRRWIKQLGIAIDNMTD
ncbi:MAG TPA: sigma 54-interacting transcriptional regulator [Polyangia bacterium]|nr:sigma 54-interacting transcriptional regulator [Polyangia bacterium]